jgi:hypothetical protein
MRYKWRGVHSEEDRGVHASERGGEREIREWRERDNKSIIELGSEIER